MLKPLTFSLSLAVALGICSVSMAGGYDTSCATCGLASPQGVVASPQGATYGGCDTCKPAHKFCFTMPKLPHFSLPKLNCTTSYEWVLKKKHNISITHGGGHANNLWPGVLDRPRCCSFWPGRNRAVWSGLHADHLSCSSGLRGWPARLPGCQAHPCDRVGSFRADPANDRR